MQLFFLKPPKETTTWWDVLRMQNQSRNAFCFSYSCINCPEERLGRGFHSSCTRRTSWWLHMWLLHNHLVIRCPVVLIWSRFEISSLKVTFATSVICLESCRVLVTEGFLKHNWKPQTMISSSVFHSTYGFLPSLPSLLILSLPFIPLPLHALSEGCDKPGKDSVLI